MFANRNLHKILSVLAVMISVMSFAGVARADERGHHQDRDDRRGHDRDRHEARDQHEWRHGDDWRRGDGWRHSEPRRWEGFAWRHREEHFILAPVWSAHEHAHHEYVHGGVRFYFGGGNWYRHDRDRFFVVAPPVGIIIPFLPPFASMVWVSGSPYYYANNVYYARCAQGYTVVQVPPAVTDYAPPMTLRESPAADNGVVELGPVGATPSVTVAQSRGPQLFIYPRNGQSSQQQDRDREECNDWAVSQTGVAGLSDPNTLRAMSACLDGRGYTVK